MARDLPTFGLKVSKQGTEPCFVRGAHKRGAEHLILGTVDETTAEKALIARTAVKAKRETNPLFADFAAEFTPRQGRRWQPSTRQGNCHLIDRHISALHVLGGCPRRGGAPRPSHPRLPAPLGFAERHEQCRAHHRRAAARTPPARNHGNLRASGRWRAQGCCHTGCGRHRPCHGIPGGTPPLPADAKDAANRRNRAERAT